MVTVQLPIIKELLYFSSFTHPESNRWTIHSILVAYSGILKNCEEFSKGNIEMKENYKSSIL